MISFPFNLLLLSFVITLINLLIKVFPMLFTRGIKWNSEGWKEVLFESVVVSLVLFGVLLLCHYLLSLSNSQLMMIGVTIIGATFFTTFDFFIRPIIQFYTSSELKQHEGLANVLKSRFPAESFKLKVIDKPVLNAYATGVLGFTKYILVGRELMHSLTETSLQAIILHEAGHLKKNHLRTIFLSAFIISCCYGISVFYTYPYFEQLTITPVLIFLHGAGFGFFIIMIPALIQRKCEYEADQFAAAIIGIDTYVEALKELDDLSDGKVAKGGLTHPNLEKRLAKVRSMGAKGKVSAE
jgi:STE24 endopeptidase